MQRFLVYGLWIQGLGFRVFWVWGLRDLRFRVEGLGDSCLTFLFRYPKGTKPQCLGLYRDYSNPPPNVPPKRAKRISTPLPRFPASQ